MWRYIIVSFVNLLACQLCLVYHLYTKLLVFWLHQCVNIILLYTNCNMLAIQISGSDWIHHYLSSVTLSALLNTWYEFVVLSGESTVIYIWMPTGIKASNHSINISSSSRWSLEFHHSFFTSLFYNPEYQNYP